MNVNAAARLPALEMALGFGKEAQQAVKDSQPFLRSGKNSEIVLRGLKKQTIAQSREGFVPLATDAITHARDAAAALRTVDDPDLETIAAGFDADAASLGANLSQAQTKRKLGTGSVSTITSKFDESVTAIQERIRLDEELAKLARQPAKPAFDFDSTYEAVIRANSAAERARAATRYKTIGYDRILSGVRPAKVERSRQKFIENATQAAEAAGKAAEMLSAGAAKHQTHAQQLLSARGQMLEAVRRAESGSRLIAPAGTNVGFSEISNVAYALRPEKSLRDLDVGAAGRAERLADARAAVESLHRLEASI